MRNTTAMALIAGVALAAGQAAAGSFTFTDGDDWDAGTYSSTFSEPNPPGDDATTGVKLRAGVVTQFDFIWVALSGRDSIARIDTDHVDPDGVSTLADSAAGLGAVQGEYYTTPDPAYGNPSRTTVDLNGDVWVGNRDEGRGGQGSIAKVAVDPGAGPTSTGVWNGSTFDRLDWNNAGGVDTDGGTDTAEDTAIKLFVRTPSTNNRTIAIDANNDVWVGGYGDKEHGKYDGASGAQIGGTVDVNAGGYGGVIDGNGVLWSSNWSSSNIGRYDTTVADPATSHINTVNTGGKSYGLAVDNDGNIWNTHYDQRTVSKISSDGSTVIFTKPSGGNLSRGVAITPDNNAWIANSGSNTVTRLDTNGNILQTIAVGSYPTGVSVDSNGKIWVTNLNSNSVMRIDPMTNAVDLTVELGANASPYNYSDMTGSVVGGITNPTGTWSTIIDGGADLTSWDQIFWNEEMEGFIPADGMITVEIRTADTEVGLSGAAWMAYDSGDLLGLTGRWAELRATLKRAGTVGALTPVLSDITLTNTTNPVPLPASWLLLASGAAGLAALRRRKMTA